MPPQDATIWSPDTCGCQLYIRVDAAGNPVFIHSDDVRAEHQARIAAGDPTANPVLAEPHQACPDHAALGHVPSQALIGVIQEEQARRNRALALAKAIVDVAPQGFEWSFASDRTLHVRIGKLSPAQRARGRLLEGAGRFLTPAEVAELNLLMVGNPLSAAERSMLQVQAELEFGPGKVLVS